MNYINCIDAATEYCPCKLAEVDECLICSQLKGEKFCDCINYSGTCIYQEYVWNKNSSKKTREYKLFNIVYKNIIREDIVLMKIKLNNTLCRELNNIGAFVFLKSPGDDESLSIPVSIVESDINTELITVIIKKIGVKSKTVINCKDQILVKGPYLNGIQGQMNIKNIKSQRLLVIGRGIALAPAVMATKKLKERNNEVKVILHRGRGEKSYFTSFFEGLNCEVENIGLLTQGNELSEEAKVLIKNESNGSILVLSAGDDDFHRQLIKYVYSLNTKIKFSTVNNSTMCCGEGNCGSCIIDFNGNIIRTCKEQYNPLSVFGGGKL